MLITSAIWAALVLLFLVRWWMRSGRTRGDLDRIPGPTASPWIKLLRPDTREHLYPQVAMTEAARKYGPIFKLKRLNGDALVIVANYDLIYQVLVSCGKEFGGRSKLFRLEEGFASSGILQNTEPDEKWKLLRKICHRHLRMFGDGLGRLEHAVTEIADDLFRTFEQNEGTPFNPKAAFFDVTVNTMTYLIAGQRCTPGDHLAKLMKRYLSCVSAVIPSVTPLSFELMDAIPWLRHLGLPSWKIIQEMRKIEVEAWEEVIKINNADPDIQSICRVFQQYMKSAGEAEMVVSDREARVTGLLVMIGGVVTTHETLCAAVNILAHHPKVQDKMVKDIEKIVGSGRSVSLADRPDLHYIRAFILEVLRYHSVSPLAATHRACRDTDLGGYLIPKDTRVATALYLLHHDEEFWGDPYNFRPERFLDEKNQLVPADHANRKHVLPFGAGTRVCMGETLALLRLFLWLSHLVQKYVITPAPGNIESLTDPRNFTFDGVLVPPDYEVILTRR